MKLNKPAIALGLASIPISLLAKTQIETVVVSASKFEQKLSSVTANVYVITAEEIQTKNYTTITQALNQVSGISFTSNGGLGKNTSVFMRGFDSGRIILMLDGVRLNDNSTNNGGAPYQHILMHDIERIEIIKGPQSGVWGANATAGVINVISKSATQKLQSHLNIETGSYGTRKINGGLKQAFDKFDYTLNISNIESTGFTARAPKDTDIDDLESDAYENATIQLKTGINFTPKDRLELSLNYIDAETEIDRFANDNTGINDHKQRATLVAYKHKEGASNWTLKHQQTIIDRDDPGGFTKEFDSITNESSIQFDHQFHQDKFLSIGANSTNFIYKNDIDENYTNQGLFISHSHKLGNTVLNEVLRHDAYTKFDNQTTFKLGAKHSINPQTKIWVNYGTAYNVPTLYQRYGSFGSKDLTPDKTRSADIGASWHKVAITYFDNRVENLLDFDNATFKYVNVEGISTSRGYELEYLNSFGSVDLALNYTHTATETNNQNVNFTLRRAKDQVGADLSWYATDKLDVNLNVQWIGERPKGYFDSQPGSEYYSVVDTSINYQFNKNLKGYIKVDNLTNKYYQIIDGYATAERSAYIGLNANF